MPGEALGSVVEKAFVWHDRVREHIAKEVKARSEKSAAVTTETKSTNDKQVVTFKAIGCDEWGVITGIGGAAGSLLKLDGDEEFLEKGDLVKLAWGFTASAQRQFKANHDDNHLLDADLVQSWVGAPIIKAGEVARILGDHESLTRDMEVVGINTEKGNEGWWFVTVRPHDPRVIEAAKAGLIEGFSWGASVTKTPV